MKMEQWADGQRLLEIRVDNEGGGGRRSLYFLVAARARVPDPICFGSATR